MIYFNNTEGLPNVDYEDQNATIKNGKQYILIKISLSNNQESVKNRVIISVVRDSKTNNLIVKWVSLLPVAVDSSIDIKKNYNFVSQEANKTVLKEVPSDKKVRLVVSSSQVLE